MESDDANANRRSRWKISNTCTVYDVHPPFCHASCGSTHHPVLVTLLNCHDNQSNGALQMKLKALGLLVIRYEEAAKSKWNRDLEIPDVEPNIQMPILHWACSLGLIGVLHWIKANGYSMKTQLQPCGETGFHKALINLPTTCPNDAAEKFTEMISIMETSLLMGNDLGNSPLHLCCEMLRNKMPHPVFYVSCINAILNYVQLNFKSLRQGLFLQNQNNDGDTPLHILARNETCHHVIKMLIDSGAKLKTHNLEGHSPYAVAMLNGQSKLLPLLLINTMSSVAEEYQTIQKNSQSKTSKRSLTTPTASTSDRDIKKQNISTGDVFNDDESTTREVTAEQDPTPRSFSPLSTVTSITTDMSSQDSTSISSLSLRSVRRESSVTSVSSSPLSDSSSEDEVLESSVTDQYNIYLTNVILPVAMIDAIHDEVNALELQDSDKMNMVAGLIDKAKYKKLLKESLETLNVTHSEVLTSQEEAPSLCEQVAGHTSRLTDMKTEEKILKKLIKASQMESMNIENTLWGLNERLAHCQDALDALSPLVNNK